MAACQMPYNDTGRYGQEISVKLKHLARKFVIIYALTVNMT